MEHEDQGEAARHAAETAAMGGIISKLRTSPAHGVSGNERAFTEWHELGYLLSTGSYLADMAADPVKRRLAKALAASPDIDRNSISEITERAYRHIVQLAVDDWDRRASDDDEQEEDDGDEEGDALDVEALPVPGAEHVGLNEDTAYLKSLIDGTGDLLAEDVFEKLEPMFTTYMDNAEMMALLERAANTYGDAAVAAALRALDILNPKLDEDPDDFADMIDTTWDTGFGRMSQADIDMHTQAGFTVLCSTDLYRDHDILLTSDFLFATLARASNNLGPHSTVLKLADHVTFIEDLRQSKYLVCMAEDAEKLIALGYATKVGSMTF
ncbi:MAG: hypothetical protein Q8S96_02340 [Hydrogenophaga sp.]|uniref:hypothetical protein n=1 Tax=Hydrogenophaga sp. TaxID=1904254 RepID=UPI00271839E9|nr:hypothetical protein [Hydrogenophaga sp.]MDO9481132.1 hypothetical protein [Hydrogenophaga sp.]MDP3343280.1 hypothetical protein [Hydrogenophaga sp.]MDP3805731.1 hypothetical protein [Hydrogenophaga sp.]MDP3925188.1 hypothetical protein [Hydrogenophaga sp.]